MVHWLTGYLVPMSSTAKVFASHEGVIQDVLDLVSQQIAEDARARSEKINLPENSYIGVSHFIQKPKSGPYCPSCPSGHGDSKGATGRK